MRPALATGNVHLSTRTRVLRLRTDPTGRRVVAADVERDGERFAVRGDVFVLAAGAANTTAILLRRAGGTHPRGLANNADCVGRYYMQHNMSAVLAMAPFRLNDTVFQKTLAVNDVYPGGAHTRYPLGSLATFGKVTGPILKALRPQLPCGSCTSSHSPVPTGGAPGVRPGDDLPPLWDRAHGSGSRDLGGRSDGAKRAATARGGPHVFGRRVPRTTMTH